MNEQTMLKEVFNRKFFQSTKFEKYKILFRRDYKSYTGGHQKVFDYYKHFIDLGCNVDIYFTEDSIWNKTNPWLDESKNIVQEYKPKNYDLLFIAGADWNALEPGIENEVPVINLIQGFRSAKKKHKRLDGSLSRKAIRIAVSKEVGAIIRDIKIVNGPVYTIPNGHEIPEIHLEKTNNIYIMGKKNTELAIELEKIFIHMGYRTICSTTRILRNNVFTNMATSSITVLLPSPKIQEGFFLPALEAMKYSDLTIVPDCVGNRSFCFDKKNCLIPQYTKEDIVEKVKVAIGILKNKELLNKYKSEALLTVNKHSIEIEKTSFYKILNDVFFKKGETFIS